MKAFNNLKTALKLVLGFGVVVLVLIAVAYMGYSNMKTINDGMATLYFDSILPLEQLGSADTAIYGVRCDTYKYMLIPEQRAKTKQSIEANKQIVKEELDKF